MLTTTEKKDASIAAVIWVDPERMSGAPCFYGTRVPVKTLFDYLESGSTLEEFLEDFEGVTDEQAKAVIHLAMEGFLRELNRAA